MKRDLGSMMAGAVMPGDRASAFVQSQLASGEPQFGTAEIATDQWGPAMRGIGADHLIDNKTLPALNLTPAMREQIKRGLPYFSLAPAAVIGAGMGGQQDQTGL